MDKITAQVAVEAIAEHPNEYSRWTIEQVRASAERAGVARMYLDLLPAAVGQPSQESVLIQGSEFQL